MRLEQLEYVLEVARAGSINKATKNLYISQPQLSTSIKQLEQELNIKIFTRDSKGVILTPAGEELVRLSKEVNKNLGKMKNICHKYDSYVKPVSLNIASMPSYVVVDLFQQLVMDDEGAKNNLSLIETPDCIKIIDSVEKNMSELGIIFISSIDEKDIASKLHSKNLHFTEIYQEPLHIYIGRNNPLWGKDSVSINDCSNQLIAINTSAKKEYRTIIEHCNLDANKIVVFNDIRSLMHFVSKSQGLSFGMRIANISNNYVTSNLLTFIPISGINVSMKVGWIKPSGTTLSSVAQSFVEILEEFFKKQLSPSKSPLEHHDIQNKNSQ
ncbi:DNA-binding transcriptional LysR family regulator [Desulfitispora alkaliphila]|uniref:LysR family transcriptional regulator n=1 Tax=Desulfitispora alkaliphila TaxID=622674 RepID=UPI003D1F914D